MNCVGSPDQDSLPLAGPAMEASLPRSAREALLQDKASHSRARARGLSSRLFRKATAGLTPAFLQQPRLHCFFSRSPAFKTKSESLETSGPVLV